MKIYDISETNIYFKLRDSRLMGKSWQVYNITKRQ